MNESCHILTSRATQIEYNGMVPLQIVSVLQCVAVRCSVSIQHTSRNDHVRQNIAQSEHELYTATHCNTCNTLQHTATHCSTCNTLQHTARHCNTLQHTATHCNTLQHTATHKPVEMAMFAPTSPGPSTNCTLQHTATHCNTLQHTATHCNTL